MIKQNILCFRCAAGARFFFLRAVMTFLFPINLLFAQSDTQAIKNLYDRVLDFDDLPVD